MNNQTLRQYVIVQPLSLWLEVYEPSKDGHRLPGLKWLEFLIGNMITIEGRLRPGVFFPGDRLFTVFRSSIWSVQNASKDAYVGYGIVRTETSRMLMVEFRSEYAKAYKLGTTPFFKDVVPYTSESPWRIYK